MTPIFTPSPMSLPVPPAHTSGAPTSGTVLELATWYVGSGCTAATPGMRAIAARRCAAVRIAMPEYTLCTEYRVRAEVAGSEKWDCTERACVVIRVRCDRAALTEAARPRLRAATKARTAGFALSCTMTLTCPRAGNCDGLKPSECPRLCLASERSAAFLAAPDTDGR